MNRVALWILAQIIFLISAQAVPPVLNYAGQVTVNGEAFDGNGLFKFALVNADGTTTFWSNDGTSVDGSEPQASVAVPVNGGLYAVLLGNSAQPGMGAIDPAVFAQHNDAKLRVWFSDGVNGFQQLSPDRPFASVPYAFSAGVAQTAGFAPIANGAVNLDMLSEDLKTQINAPISRSRLTQEVVADINATIGLDRLSSEIISKLEQNATITNGSVTGSKMADGAITTDKLNEQILKYLKPEITSQPQAQTVYADTNASISVTAEGKYLTYQWKKDGADLTGETNATLNITDANATLHDGNYSVVVSNDFGSVESIEVEMIVGTWNPNAIFGLEVWLDGSDVASFIQTSNSIEQWIDKSGNENHFSQSNASHKPTVDNGGVKFDLGDKLTCVNVISFNVLNIFYVKRSNRNQCLDFHDTTNGGRHSLCFGGTEGSLSGAFGNPNYFKNGLGITISSRSIAKQVFHDGTKNLASIMNCSTSGWNTFIISGYQNYQYVGDYYEIIMVSGLMDISEQQKIEGFLANKWGLTADLPLDHPYKNNAP